MIRKKKYLEMTPAELREATSQYDDPAYRPKETPMTAAQRERLRRTMRSLKKGYVPGKRGRSAVGRGAARVLVTVERGLLELADAMAKREQISRSALVSLGLAMLVGRGNEP